MVIGQLKRRLFPSWSEFLWNSFITEMKKEDGLLGHSRGDFAVTKLPGRVGGGRGHGKGELAPRVSGSEGPPDAKPTG